MDIEQTEIEIKKEEGFRMEVYEDTLGHKTGGWGHKMMPDDVVPKDKIGWQVYFDKDFDRAKNGCEELLTLCPDIPETAKHIVLEMVYQMGAYGVSRFKGMLKALQDEDYKLAAVEMLDSRWAKQTPNRANRMAQRMENV
jgi:lysozyme